MFAFIEDYRRLERENKALKETLAKTKSRQVQMEEKYTPMEDKYTAMRKLLRKIASAARSYVALRGLAPIGLGVPPVGKISTGCYLTLGGVLERLAHSPKSRFHIRDCLHRYPQPHRFHRCPIEGRPPLIRFDTQPSVSSRARQTTDNRQEVARTTLKTYGF